MTTKRTLLLGLLLVALIVACWRLLPLASRSRQPVSIPPEDRSSVILAEKEELEKFQGTWDFVSLEVNGEQKPDEDFKRYTVVFKGDQWIVFEGTNVAAQKTIQLNPAANPKCIDAYPPPGTGPTIRGIYVLEGDTLTVCDRGEDNGGRPTEFRTEPNSGLVLFVYKRPQQ